jgi:serine/threonine protein kinase
MCPGRTETAQLQKIFKLLGTPKLEEWPQILELPLSRILRESVEFSISYAPQNLEDYFAGTVMTREGLDLLRRLLIYNPALRLSAADALMHPFFADIAAHAQAQA